MDNIPISSSEEKKLMKSFFALKDAFDTMRNTMRNFPSILGQLSITEVYDFLNEVIELVGFIRRYQDDISGYRNPIIKSESDRPLTHQQFVDAETIFKEPTSYTNVGGLIKMTFPRIRVPLTEKEKSIIQSLQYAVVALKKELEAGVQPTLSVSVISNKSKKTKKRHRRYRYYHRNRKK